MHAGAGRPRDGPLGRPGRRGRPPAPPPSRRPGAPRACSLPAGTRAPPARASPAVTPEQTAAGSGPAPRGQRGSPAAGAQRGRAPPRVPAWPPCHRSQWLRACAGEQQGAPMRRAQREHGAARHEHACDPSQAQRAPSRRTSLCRHASAGSARRGASCAHASRSGSSTCGRPRSRPLPPGSRVAHCWAQAGTAGEPGRLPAPAPAAAEIKLPGPPVGSPVTGHRQARRVSPGSLPAAI